MLLQSEMLTAICLLEPTLFALSSPQAKVQSEGLPIGLGYLDHIR